MLALGIAIGAVAAWLWTRRGRAPLLDRVAFAERLAAEANERDRQSMAAIAHQATFCASESAARQHAEHALESANARLAALTRKATP